MTTPSQSLPALPAPSSPKDVAIHVIGPAFASEIASASEAVAGLFLAAFVTFLTVAPWENSKDCASFLRERAQKERSRDDERRK